MKSFVTFPEETEKKLLSNISNNLYNDNFPAHYELHKKISNLEGSMVKCGIASKKDLAYFASFQNLVTAKAERKVIAFQKSNKNSYLKSGSKETENFYKSRQPVFNSGDIFEVLPEEDVPSSIDFIPGNVGDSISAYLIENPDLKIAYLAMDMDDYEGSLTILQFFYPRLIIGGILVIENYYKREDDYKAASEFFKYLDIKINSFSTSYGPNYIIRN